MAAAQLQSGVYFIQNVNTGTVLELVDGSAANSTRIQGYHKRELSDRMVSAQLWIVVQVESGKNVYTIQNANSRSFADLSGSGLADGTPVIGYQATGNPNQRWIITRSENNAAYYITNQATGTNVDLYAGGSADGTAVNGWSVIPKSVNQLWNITRA